jgi:DNA-binding MarR family transcriptional regulator
LSDLAEGLNISNAAVTKMTDRLEKKGLVERVQFSGDRRATALQLTEQGKTLLDNMRGAELEAWETIVGRMKSTEKEALLSGMTAFIQAMLEDIEDTSEVCLKCGTEHDSNCPLGQNNKSPVDK